MSGATGPRGRPYMNPYLAGVGIGTVLLLAFVIMGRGLGASGAFSTAVATGVSVVAPAHAAERVAYEAYLPAGRLSFLTDWLVLELVGVTLGGFLSALLAGRFRIAVDKGPRISTRGRIAFALAGGCLMGVGAKLARGCTSGQAITGGALLSVGSWLFIVTAFAAGYLVAPLIRKAWT
jgi:uncharacterized membrane protein YedE/YeeE